MKRIYLDYASSTPLSKRVQTAYASALKKFGNPSAIHAEGRDARAALGAARKAVAQSFEVKPEQLTFTSGGTESNALALLGVARALHARGISYSDQHFITSDYEHSSLANTCALLEELGAQVTYVIPGDDGRVTVESVMEALRPNTVLVSLAHVNSETGVIMPLRALGTELRKYRTENVSIHSKAITECAFPLLHADAAQSPLYLDASPHALQSDLVSYDAQKVLGPKGVGILYKSDVVPMKQLYGGGSQERGVRPGTENTPAVVAAGVAFSDARLKRAQRTPAIAARRDKLLYAIIKALPDAVIVGTMKHRIANNIFIRLPEIDTDYLTVCMDTHGIAVSPRSACVGSTTGGETLRLTLGDDFRVSDIPKVITALCKSVALQRAG